MAMSPIKHLKSMFHDMRLIMSNNVFYVLTIAFFMLLSSCLSACSTKQGAIANLADLTEEVQANGSNYSEDDWNAVAEELAAIESEIEQYREEYTDEELKEIGRLKGVLLAQYTKYSVQSIKDGVENAMKEAEGLIDGFINGVSNGSSE